MLNTNEVLIRRQQQQLWEIMAIVAGFGLFIVVLTNFALHAVMALHAKIVLASSIFYMSVAQNEVLQKKSVPSRIKHELVSRGWMPQPDLLRWRSLPVHLLAACWGTKF